MFQLHPLRSGISRLAVYIAAGPMSRSLHGGRSNVSIPIIVIIYLLVHEGIIHRHHEVGLLPPKGIPVHVYPNCPVTTYLYWYILCKVGR